MATFSFNWVSFLLNYLALITSLDVKGVKRDLKWKFTKKAGRSGLFHANREPYSLEHTLVSSSYMLHVHRPKLLRSVIVIEYLIAVTILVTILNYSHACMH